MSQEFPHVTILGSGLLGGSLALVLQQQDDAPSVKLWARRVETIESAKAIGISGATADLNEAVRDADLLVLAVPVGAMAALVRMAIDSGLPEHCLITDVGSVKCKPHQSIGECIATTSHHFIGSHPMAGSEQGGVESATADLFKGAACLLTNDDDVADDKALALECFWQQVGCQTTWMDAKSHDALVARISHLPHIIAAAAARTCLESPADGAFGGGGLRDTTRVAAGNPEMWAEIVMENREALAAPLRQTIDDLMDMLRILDSGEQEAARQWLITAKDRRDPLNPPR